ncbi:MAG: GWxTD domain-containing protein, partial [Melioribacteraceae bacterium]
WKIRDGNPATPQNEFKEEYEKRVTFANKNFTRMNKEGYLTDRGRVVLLYGEPDQRDYYPSESNLKPYEVWFYNQIEGGVSFYFGDVTGFGNYELLHSTKRDELHDENWMRRISTQ